MAETSKLRRTAFVICAAAIAVLFIAAAAASLPKLAVSRHEYTPTKWKYAFGNQRMLIYEDMVNEVFTVAPSRDRYSEGSKLDDIADEIGWGEILYEYTNRNDRIDLGYKLASDPVTGSRYLVLEFYCRRLVGYYVTYDYLPDDTAE